MAKLSRKSVCNTRILLLSNFYSDNAREAADMGRQKINRATMEVFGIHACCRAQPADCGTKFFPRFMRHHIGGFPIFLAVCDESVHVTLFIQIKLLSIIRMMADNGAAYLL